MNYLLDTNVLSETRRSRPDRRVLRWLRETPPGSLYVSVLTLGEIAKGIAVLEMRDAPRALSVAQWLNQIRVEYGRQVISIDGTIAELWGRLSASRTLPVIDGLLAATALVHGMKLATRNVRDLKDTGVAVFDPWA